MKKSAHQIWKEAKEQNLSNQEIKEIMRKEGVVVKKDKLKVKKWKSLRKYKPKENNNLYDILLNNDLVVRDCTFVRKGIIFTQVDSKESYNFNEINSWRNSLNNLKISCNADCPEAEYGNCCHPSDCQKTSIIT